jgi:hypothetical protein
MKVISFELQFDVLVCPRRKRRFPKAIGYPANTLPNSVTRTAVNRAVATLCRE